MRHALDAIVGFVVGTGTGYVVNVWLVQDELGYDRRVGWGLAISFGLIVAIGAAFRVNERV